MEKVYPAKTECKLYRRRWLMLAIFFCFSVGNVYQWIQYSIISNIITKYYDVPTVAVDFTSMIFMIGMKVPMIIGTFLTALGACIKLLSVSPDRFWVTFVGQTSVALGQLFLLSVPPTLAAIWFGEKEVSTACAIGTIGNQGMKVPMIIGTFLTALGACIKLLSVSPDRFWVTFVGQTSVALGQLFLLSVPPTLAAIWFGEKEVSTACAIGTIGNQLGIVMGFLIPPMVVHDHDNIDDIGDELMLIFICSAAFNSFIFLCTLGIVMGFLIPPMVVHDHDNIDDIGDELMLIFICSAAFNSFIFLCTARPPLPPSPQQALQWENSANNVDSGFRGFIKLMKRLLCYRDFMFLLFAYSFNQAVLNSVSTLLNQVILNYFEDEVEFAGYVGVVFVAGGILGGFIFGPILDRTRKYKLVSCIMYALSTLGMLGFTFILKTKSQVLVYIVTAVFG
ncbi:hypothetical protein C0J52_09502 [Blattella germanica]|nr:hypothetical protein C0J52_09502 [Blattella germanica]